MPHDGESQHQRATLIDGSGADYLKSIFRLQVLSPPLEQTQWLGQVKKLLTASCSNGERANGNMHLEPVVAQRSSRLHFVKQ